jgi:hypothetical protein
MLPLPVIFFLFFSYFFLIFFLFFLIFYFSLKVNLSRLIVSAQKQFKIQNNKMSDLNPLHIINQINILSNQLIVVRGMLFVI